MVGGTETQIADLLRTKNRFLRSANLERDFRDPNVFSGYVVTDFAQSCLTRLCEGLKPKSGQRAWRLTGDYGSGKSSFALLVAHWFAGHDQILPRTIRSAQNRRPSAPSRKFLPALVTCSRQPLTISILRSLREALTQATSLSNKSKLLGEVGRLLDSPNPPGEDAVLDLVVKVNACVVANSRHSGLLIVIDELGKFLEFAAIHPERQDVFLLQRLAEAACRSGKQPFFMVCLLHQGFSAYADHLNQAAQREWEKVAGRLEEIVFNQPIEQIAELISSALNVRTDIIPKHKAHGIKQAMQSILPLGWYGPAASKRLTELALELFPLHPTVLPVLIRSFRRFGQNERSLFSFLLSSEPFGLQVFCANRLDRSKPYSLHDFYDYVRTNFGHRLAVQTYRSHWNLIDAVVESFAADDELQIKILKTVGILNLLNDTDLPASEEALICSLAGHDEAKVNHVKTALRKLHKEKRVLYDRGKARGYCLWPHTSVDLERAYENASRATSPQHNVAPLISDYLESRPLVARRHYIKTGNLRYYSVCYRSVAELPKLFDMQITDSDGLIIVPLCETESERARALAFAKSEKLIQRSNWLIGVPQPLGGLRSLVQEVQRWEWVATNIPELNADKYAREEVSRQKQAARTQLERRVQTLVGLRQFEVQTTIEWLHKGRALKIGNSRDLLSALSGIFDDIYSLAPKIQNELVNRNELSSAAAAARMRLIERMFNNAQSPLLGMNSAKKPPEISMYLSALKRTGIHRQQGGFWRIDEPHYRTDVCRVLPAFRRIHDIVRERPDSRVSVASIFEELRRPPYGVRNGIIPLLITAFAVAHDKDIAFYKDGTFLREMTGEAMLVLTKAPERFDIQYCKIGGVRAALFEKLVALLELKRSEKGAVKLLDVVKPLCVFVAQLPNYVLNTRRLTPTALAVRETILNAREPAKLLFYDLPSACGFEPVRDKQTAKEPDRQFVKALKVALDELRAAYPELQERLRARLREAFILPGSFREFRTNLSARAEHLLLAVTEPKLRAFCLRLMDNNLTESDWLDSLCSHIALKPPAKWHDAEEDLFNAELPGFVRTFHSVESILFKANDAPTNSIGVRLAITHSSGLEHEQVIHFTVEEESRLVQLETEFDALLADNTRLGLAAASRSIWKSLQNGGKAKHD
jgi:hypothetical protein